MFKRICVRRSEGSDAWRIDPSINGYIMSL
jgi:hypothetical protein